MGVSIDVYRCRIGCFQPRASHSLNAQDRSKSTSVVMRHLPLILLCILLLIAGIEPNPGPSHPRSREHPCQYCEAKFLTVHVLCKHLKVHQSLKKFSIRCTFPGCRSVLSSVSSFKTHVLKLHAQDVKSESVREQSERPQPLQSFRCPIYTCTEECSDRKAYMLHMVKNHLMKGEAFQCSYNECSTELRFITQFRQHMSRYHAKPSVLLSSCLSWNVNDGDGNCVQNTEEVDDDFPDEDFSVPYDSPPDQDLYPDHVIREELSKFYLKLESQHLLPTSTVQSISEEITIFTELIHHQLKRSLKKELQDLMQLEAATINSVIDKTFKRDTLYNVHHKHEDVEFMGSNYMRMKYWKDHYPFVVPVRIPLDSNGSKPRYAHHIPVRKTLEVLLRDKEVKRLVLESFDPPPKSNPEILSDFTDGTAFQDHVRMHHGGSKKCLQLIICQDAVEFNAFGASAGQYKPNPFYYTLGNLPPKYRTNLDFIQLCYMILEKDLKLSQEEELKDIDKLKKAMQPLLDELADLKIKGIEFNGENIPVCLLFLVGDSLGQHVFGGFVKNFTAEFWCRYCPISKTFFKANASETESLRTAAEYDEYVNTAKKKWLQVKKQSLDAKEKSNRQAAKKSGKVTKATSAYKTSLNTIISKSAFMKLIAVNFRGVKYRPSPFNSEALGFHVISSQPPCIAHDLFEGIVKKVLPAILKHFIETKEWFDLTCLNKRIKQFQCKGADRSDAPVPLKKLDSLCGGAIENWNLLRLLPFMIDDLILDRQDPMWKLYLQLKEITEYVCAVEITFTQVNYLQSLIKGFAEMIQVLLPSCLIPKLHFLCHYPGLILLFGPLVRLFTLRFESKHMFFKQVARACKSYVNITFTLSKKYMCRFAFDHLSEIIPADVKYNVSSTRPLLISEVEGILGENFNYEDFEEVTKVTISGIEYSQQQFVILGHDESCDLNVGCIFKILVQVSSNQVMFIVDKRAANNSGDGYYKVEKSVKEFQLMSLDQFADFYPLECYEIRGQDCFSLKRSNPSMFD